jgi:DUF4097 and DUF4098 domain-containing protein YvlB
MKTLPVSLAVLSAFALVGGLIAPAQAETFKIPDKHPVVSVTYPDSWKPEEIDRGAQGQTEDSAVYLSVEASKSEKGMNEIIDGTFDMFKEHKVEIDKSTKKINKMEIAGEPAEEMLFTGKDEDGPTVISITTFTVGDTVIIISYWASASDEAKYSAAIGKIVSSIEKL